MIKVLLIAAAVLILLLVICSIADTNRFVTVTYRFSAGVGKRPFRCVFLSDIHEKVYGKNNDRLFSAIDACEPACILIGGDMMKSVPGVDVQWTLEFVKRLREKYPVYYAFGNHEHRLFLYPERYGDSGEKLQQGLEQLGVVSLVNDSVFLEEYGISISGLKVHKRFYRRGILQHLELDQMQKWLKPVKEPGYKILLAHNPDYFSTYKEWGADLVLSGHVHGGIVRLPFLGGVVSPRIALFPKYDGGRFDEDGKTMIVSRGLGVHTLPFRLFNPGELVNLIIE